MLRVLNSNYCHEKKVKNLPHPHSRKWSATKPAAREELKLRYIAPRPALNV